MPLKPVEKIRYDTARITKQVWHTPSFIYLTEVLEGKLWFAEARERRNNLCYYLQYENENNAELSVLSEKANNEFSKSLSSLLDACVEKTKVKQLLIEEGHEDATLPIDEKGRIILPTAYRCSPQDSKQVVKQDRPCSISQFIRNAGRMLYADRYKLYRSENPVLGITYLAYETSPPDNRRTKSGYIDSSRTIYNPLDTYRKGCGSAEKTPIKSVEQRIALFGRDKQRSYETLSSGIYREVVFVGSIETNQGNTTLDSNPFGFLEKPADCFAHSRFDYDFDGIHTKNKIQEQSLSSKASRFGKEQSLLPYVYLLFAQLPVTGDEKAYFLCKKKEVTVKKTVPALNRVVRMMRWSKALLPKEFADQMSFSRSYIAEIESGKNISDNVLAAYCERFDCNKEYLELLTRIAEETSSDAELLVKIVKMEDARQVAIVR